MLLCRVPSNQLVTKGTRVVVVVVVGGGTKRKWKLGKRISTEKPLGNNRI